MSEVHVFGGRKEGNKHRFLHVNKQKIAFGILIQVLKSEFKKSHEIDKKKKHPSDLTRVLYRAIVLIKPR